MNSALLQQTYQSLLGQARQLQGQYSSDIQRKASTLDAGEVMSLVKNS
jgi:hypothetical protein